MLTKKKYQLFSLRTSHLDANAQCAHTYSMGEKWWKTHSREGDKERRRMKKRNGTYEWEQKKTENNNKTTQNKAEQNKTKQKKSEQEGDTITELCIWKMYASINVTLRLKRC